MVDQPFAWARVVDLTTGIAGAYAAKVLADLGAQVVALEHDGPDGAPLRRRGGAGATGLVYDHLRAGHHRREIADIDDARQWVARAHLVLDDRSWPDLDPDELVSAEAGRSAVFLTPYGLSTPWSDRPASGFVVEVASGAVDRRGLPGREPVAAGGDLVEWLTGSFAATAGATALRATHFDGVGQRIDLSMLEVAVLCLNGPYSTIASQWYPDLRLPRSVEVPSIEPAADGWIGLSTQTAQQWTDFCVMIGRPDLGEDPRFVRADERLADIDRIRAAIADHTAERTVDELVAEAVAFRLPVTPVGTGATVTTFDQFVARGVYETDPEGRHRPRPPWRISDAPPATVAQAPAGDPAGWSALPTAADRHAALPFAGLRVVDLTAFWAGPIATQYLAAMGADVIKVESTRRPDGIRFLGAFDRDEVWEWSYVFAGVNAGKRAVTLDLDHPDGRALLDRLLAGADVVIENFTPRVLENFGLGWDRLHRDHPGLCLVRMPAFGLDGPWRDRTGFAMTIEQTSGLAWITGYPDAPLVPRGPCDPVGGMHAVVALVAALALRAHDGIGRLVEVPLVDVALNLAVEPVLVHDATGEVLTAQGNRSPHEAPRGLYPCAGDDEWVGIAVRDDADWARLCTLVEGLASPARRTLADRRADHDAIDELLRGWTRRRTPAAAEAALLAAGVPAAALVRSNAAGALAPFAARGSAQTLSHRVTGTVDYPGFPMIFDRFGTQRFSGPPPTLGEHNAEVLADVGCTADELARLAAEGVIGNRPAWL